MTFEILCIKKHFGCGYKRFVKFIEKQISHFPQNGVRSSMSEDLEMNQGVEPTAEVIGDTLDSVPPKLV